MERLLFSNLVEWKNSKKRKPLIIEGARQVGTASSKNLYYYTNENSTMEIDFVIQTEKVYPVEVKAEVNLKAKSLSTVLNQNEKLTGIRFSMANYKEQERMVNIPLALVEEYFKFLKKQSSY